MYSWTCVAVTATAKSHSRAPADTTAYPITSRAQALNHNILPPLAQHQITHKNQKDQKIQSHFCLLGVEGK